MTRDEIIARLYDIAARVAALHTPDDQEHATPEVLLAVLGAKVPIIDSLQEVTEELERNTDIDYSADLFVSIINVMEYLELSFTDVTQMTRSYWQVRALENATRLLQLYVMESDPNSPITDHDDIETAISKLATLAPRRCGDF